MKVFNYVVLIVGISCVQARQNKTTKLDYLFNEVFYSPKSSISDRNLDPVTKNQWDTLIPHKSFIDLYQDGIRSYLANDWEACVDELEKALAGYRDYYEATASCRIVCEFERNRHRAFYVDDIEHLQFYEGAIRKTLCLEKCKKKLLTNLPNYFFMDKWSKMVFATRKPYEYLQLCYYKENELLKAASAAYTVLLRNQDDTMMMNNLKFYVAKIEKFENSMLEDYEQKKFVKFYLNGLDAYAAEDWPNAVLNMEQSLEQFIYDLDECRAFCEGEFDQGWHTDFISSTANHFTFCLRCKQNCTRDLSIIRVKFYEDIFDTHYEYLHFAYFKENNFGGACSAVSSFLLLQPTSVDMQHNIMYYKEIGVDKKHFTPRNEALLFHQRQQYESKILRFIDEEFVKVAETSQDILKKIMIAYEKRPMMLILDFQLTKKKRLTAKLWI